MNQCPFCPWPTPTKGKAVKIAPQSSFYHKTTYKNPRGLKKDQFDILDMWEYCSVKHFYQCLIQFSYSFLRRVGFSPGTPHSPQEANIPCNLMNCNNMYLESRCFPYISPLCLTPPSQATHADRSRTSRWKGQLWQNQSFHPLTAEMLDAGIE